MKTHLLSLAFAPTGLVRQHYRTLLEWAFLITNAVRLMTYLSTVWAIHACGRSDQHSLATWIGAMSANLTMAAWLYERNGGRFDRVVAVNAANAVMCGLTTLVIACYR